MSNFKLFHDHRECEDDLWGLSTHWVFTTRNIHHRLFSISLDDAKKQRWKFSFVFPLPHCQVQISSQLTQFINMIFLISQFIFECKNVKIMILNLSRTEVLIILLLFLFLFTALTVRYLTRRFIGEYRSNTDLLYKQTITLESGLLDVEIIDISADDEEGFPSDQIQWADAVLIVYSITDRESFSYAMRALGEIRQLQNGPITYLVANKVDLDHLREVSRNISARKLTCWNYELGKLAEKLQTLSVLDYWSVSTFADETGGKSMSTRSEHRAKEEWNLFLCLLSISTLARVLFLACSTLPAVCCRWLEPKMRFPRCRDRRFCRERVVENYSESTDWIKRRLWVQLTHPLDDNWLESGTRFSPSQVSRHLPSLLNCMAGIECESKNFPFNL